MNDRFLHDFINESIRLEIILKLVNEELSLKGTADKVLLFDLKESLEKQLKNIHLVKATED